MNASSQIQDSIIQDLINEIKIKPGYSFIEIENYLNNHNINYEGDLCWYHPQYENIIMWANMSLEFIDVLNKILKSKQVTIKQESILTYMVDGKVLTFPLATRPYPYKKTHWFPISFYPLP